MAVGAVDDGDRHRRRSSPCSRRRSTAVAKNFLAIAFSAAVAFEEIERYWPGLPHGVARVALAAVECREGSCTRGCRRNEVAAVGGHAAVGPRAVEHHRGLTGVEQCLVGVESAVIEEKPLMKPFALMLSASRSAPGWDRVRPGVLLAVEDGLEDSRGRSMRSNQELQPHHVGPARLATEGERRDALRVELRHQVHDVAPRLRGLGADLLEDLSCCSTARSAGPSRTASRRSCRRPSPRRTRRGRAGP